MTRASNVTLLLERLSRVITNHAHRDGLKPTQWEALRYLERANRFSRNPSALTAYLGMTKGTVSQTLTALERKGLITKQPVPADRRNVTIELTGAARKLLKTDPLLTIDRVVSGSTDQSLEESLRQLLSNTLQIREQQAFGACRTCRYFQQNAEGGNPHRCDLLDEPLKDSDSELICAEQMPTN